MPKRSRISLLTCALDSSASSSAVKYMWLIVCEKSCRFPSFFKYGTSSYILLWDAWKERPGERWMFPMTLLTRTRPATLQPSSACSWIWSDQCSSTHYKNQKKRKDPISQES